jgi:hypothetical protein
MRTPPKPGDRVRLSSYSQGMVINVSAEPVKCSRADGRKTTDYAVTLLIDGKKHVIAARDCEVVSE